MTVIRKSMTIGLLVAIVVALAPAQDQKTIGTFTKNSKDSPMVRTSMIVGKAFLNSQGERLGEVKDVALDPTGCSAYAIVAYTGVTDRLFAVPMAAFTTAGDAISLNLTLDRIKTAPSFEMNKWPDMTDQKWVSEVYTFYGAKPRFEGKHVVTEGPAVRTDVDVFPAGTFDSGRVRTYTGTIVRYDDATGFVTLRSGNEPERTIQLAPSTYLRQERLDLRPNETVTLKAAEVDRNGEKVFVGTEVKMNDRTVLLRDERGNPRWRHVEKEHEKEKEKEKEKDHDKQ